uniref:Putative secreted protein n=1 Tax=Anopheles darlingi TaxID=43151 RepID=A0A2M4DNJ0_ANODA
MDSGRWLRLIWRILINGLKSYAIYALTIGNRSSRKQHQMMHQLNEKDFKPVLVSANVRRRQQPTEQRENPLLWSLN